MWRWLWVKKGSELLNRSVKKISQFESLESFFQDLAVSSRKFNRLFFEVEGNKLKPEFTLKDVSAEEFENMLGVLQKTIRLTGNQIVFDRDQIILNSRSELIWSLKERETLPDPSCSDGMWDVSAEWGDWQEEDVRIGRSIQSRNFEGMHIPPEIPILVKIEFLRRTCWTRSSLLENSENICQRTRQSWAKRHSPILRHDLLKDNFLVN